MRPAGRYPRPMPRRPEDRAFTVSEITSLIKGTLEDGFPEVLVEGEVVATQSLFDDRPGELLEVEYPLPERLTRGRDRLRVGFRTGPGTSTGAVFDVRIVRPVSPAP